MRFPFRPSPSLVELALQQLRDGRPSESAYGHRVALLLTIPAFDDPVARDVRRATSGELYVVRTVWQRALDVPPRSRLAGTDLAFGRLATSLPPQRPSLWSMTVHVDADLLTPLLEAVRATTVPCAPDRGRQPLDATVFELSFGDAVHETRYRWSGEPPAGWHPLADFATRLVRLVDDPVGATRP